MNVLRRFWFTFDELPPYSPLQLGCGIAAFSLDDAVGILQSKVFAEEPKIKSVIEDVNVNSLDANHVLPNMGDVTTRGVWFPLGY